MVMSECLHPFLSVLNIIMLAACKGRGGGSGVLCVCGHVNTPSSLVSSMLHRLSLVFTLTIIIFTLSVYHLVWWSCMGGCSLECCSRSGTHGMIVRALLSLCVASRGRPECGSCPQESDRACVTAPLYWEWYGRVDGRACQCQGCAKSLVKWVWKSQSSEREPPRS